MVRLDLKIVSDMWADCRIALALGVVNQARILGGVIGLAASTIIFNIRVGKDLPLVLDPTQIHSLRQTLNAVSSFTEQQQEAVRHSFAQSFNDQLRICMYISAVCWVITWACWSKKPADLAERKEAHDAMIEGREGTSSTE